MASPCYADDHIIGHHHSLAWRDFVPDLLNYAPLVAFGYQLNLDWAASRCWYLYKAISGTNKGGVFKLFGQSACLWPHSSASIGGSQIRNAVGHLISYQVDINDAKSLSEVSWLGETETDDSLWIYSSCAWWCSPGVSFPDSQAMQKCWLQARRMPAFLWHAIAEWALVYYWWFAWSGNGAHWYWLWPDFNLCRHEPHFKGDNYSTLRPTR